MRLTSLLRKAIRSMPEVAPYLSAKAHWMAYNPFQYKTYDYMLRAIEGLVNGVYSGFVGGDFIDTMANLISGQLTQAYQQAFEDAGFTEHYMPDYLNAALEAEILNQYSFVDQFYRDIVDARIDGTSVEPLLRRAQYWADRWNSAYQNATMLIRKEMGQKLVWREGDTQDKCNTCLALDGIVMFASEWDALGLRPKNPPNNKIDCEGWHCECALVPTDARRSPNAYGRVEDILAGR